MQLCKHIRSFEYTQLDAVGEGSSPVGLHTSFVRQLETVTRTHLPLRKADNCIQKRKVHILKAQIII